MHRAPGGGAVRLATFEVAVLAVLKRLACVARGCVIVKVSHPSARRTTTPARCWLGCGAMP
jgi:hypothetical protein